MTPIPDSASAQGATNVPNPGPSATEGVEAVRNDLSGSSSWERVEALAALLEPEAFDPDQPADEVWREVTKNRAIGHAAKVITASDYRRLVEDDTTIDRVARAIHHAECGYDDLCQGYDSHGEWDRKWREDSYEAAARAAVRALREETA